MAPIRLAPNRGRDIAPLLTLFGAVLLASWHVMITFTASASASRDGAMTSCFHGSSDDRRRQLALLLGSTVGRQASDSRLRLARFSADPTLRLVFPATPIYGWDNNPRSPPNLPGWGFRYLAAVFDFLMGTMFWSRTAALNRS